MIKGNNKMDILLDTSDYTSIKYWMNTGLINGVTTNPTLLEKEGNLNVEEISKKIADLIFPYPLSVEVLTDDSKEIIRQAQFFSKWADNIVIKIPIIAENGAILVDTISALEREGIKVNCTACMSFNQAILAAKANASYISLLVGRMNDEGADGFDVISSVRKWMDDWGYESKIIAASIRGNVDVQKASLAGAHCLTIPPSIMIKMIDHHYTRETVRQFNQAASSIKIDIKEAF
jgi:transaldolase